MPNVLPNDDYFPPPILSDYPPGLGSMATQFRVAFIAVIDAINSLRMQTYGLVLMYFELQQRLKELKDANRKLLDELVRVAGLEARYSQLSAVYDALLDKLIACQSMCKADAPPLYLVARVTFPEGGTADVLVAPDMGLADPDRTVAAKATAVAAAGGPFGSTAAVVYTLTSNGATHHT